VVRSGRAIGGVEDVEDEVSSLSQFSMQRVAVVRTTFDLMRTMMKMMISHWLFEVAGVGGC
jgi:hypothetical protein